MVHRVCQAILRDAHDAEDAFQATFLVLAQRAASIRATRLARDLAAWRGATSVAASEVGRLAQVGSRTRGSAREDLGSVSPPLEWDDLGEILHAEIQRLPESQRTAVLVCELEGLTEGEAAQRLGWPVGTVRSRLARGRARLKSKLERFAPAVAWKVTEPHWPPALKCSGRGFESSESGGRPGDARRDSGLEAHASGGGLRCRGREEDDDEQALGRCSGPDDGRPSRGRYAGRRAHSTWWRAVLKVRDKAGRRPCRPSPGPCQVKPPCAAKAIQGAVRFLTEAAAGRRLVARGRSADAWRHDRVRDIGPIGRGRASRSRQRGSCPGLSRE